MQTWQHIYINQRIFCNTYISSPTAINIIVTHTPIFSTLYMQKIYEPLITLGANVFAIDFSGTGKSKGKAKVFSPQSILEDITEVAEYINIHYSKPHLFGNSGIGGIFAQYAVSAGVPVKSFAQFACVHYGDTSMFKLPKPLASMAHKLFSLCANVTFPFKEPTYKGFHEAEDNGAYKEIERVIPNFRRCKGSLFSTLIGIVIHKKSLLQQPITCPTLVFKTTHDRYFSPEHFDTYFQNLSCEKKLTTLEDVHNSYFINPAIFCNAAYQWFQSHQ